jgi:hypothetical protein
MTRSSCSKSSALWRNCVEPRLGVPGMCQGEAETGVVLVH